MTEEVGRRFAERLEGVQREQEPEDGEERQDGENREEREDLSGMARG
jgi:hypothetical protein